MSLKFLGKYMLGCDAMQCDPFGGWRNANQRHIIVPISKPWKIAVVRLDPTVIMKEPDPHQFDIHLSVLCVIIFVVW